LHGTNDCVIATQGLAGLPRRKKRENLNALKISTVWIVLTVGYPVATFVANWRSNLVNLPSAATGRWKRNGHKRNNVLAGAGVRSAIGLGNLPLLVASEGFFAVFIISPGSQVAVVFWRTWQVRLDADLAGTNKLPSR
jgi:hypothetical protein